MPTQDPDVRNGNFEEVALGYTAEQAVEEAKRCLNCKNRSCVAACPVGIKIPEFITKVAEGDFETAYQEFGKVPSASSLKESALFRQARCATNLGKKELAIKKYKKIIRL